MAIKSFKTTAYPAQEVRIHRTTPENRGTGVRRGDEDFSKKGGTGELEAVMRNHWVCEQKRGRDETDGRF